MGPAAPLPPPSTLAPPLPAPGKIFKLVIFHIIMMQMYFFCVHGNNIDGIPF